MQSVASAAEHGGAGWYWDLEGSTNSTVLETCKRLENHGSWTALLLQEDLENGGKGVSPSLPFFFSSLIILFKNMSFPWKAEEWECFL